MTNFYCAPCDALISEGEVSMALDRIPHCPACDAVVAPFDADAARDAAIERARMERAKAMGPMPTYTEGCLTKRQAA